VFAVTFQQGSEMLLAKYRLANANFPRIFLLLRVRLHYRAKSMINELARRVFDKFTPSKAAISAFLLDDFARQENSSLKLGTLLESVNAPLD
jgi:hypothetical protein